MSLKTLITGIKTQLENYEDLSYAYDSGYVAENPYQLVQKNKFPFFNIEPTGQSIEKVDNVSFKQMERIHYFITIQFATMSLKKNVAVMGDDSKTGILDFSDDIWAGIKSDRTIGGIVNGLLPGFEINIEVKELGDENNERVFVAGIEMTLEFYKDGVV